MTTSSFEEQIESIKDAINELSIETAKKAIEQLQRDGITDDGELPFLRTTYNHASSELCNKLRSLGLSFMPQTIGTHLTLEGNVYAIYNPDIFDYEEAIKWLITKYQSAQLGASHVRYPA